LKKIGIEASDEIIVRSVLAGNIADFEQIVKRYRDRVYSIGYRFFYNKNEAEDFTQDLFVRVLEKLSTFRFEAPFKYWLVRITYNYGINRKKKLFSEPDIIEFEMPDISLSLEKKPIRDEIVSLLNSSMQKLPKNYRICIDLYFYWNLPYEQIKEITGIPVNTIKSNVFRAKSILRDALRGTIAEEYYEM
jgi:RNA polymerase sigma-70 factor (ECF subfamily)